MESRRSNWASEFPPGARRNPDEFAGLYNDRTFPREDVWRGEGFAAVRTGLDVFSIRNLGGRRVKAGDVVTMSKDGKELTCRVDKVSITQTDEIKSSNCGVVVLTLVSSKAAPPYRPPPPQRPGRWGHKKRADRWGPSW